jgi:UDP-glucose 4-epimerase
MKILVTGGAGFIGSHLVEALVQDGHTVRVLDNLSTGKRSNLDSVGREVEIVEGDCADLALARKAVRGVEVVYHEAAIPSVARSVHKPVESHRSNATATLHMLVAARDAGVRRFVFAGSSSVYGDRPGLPKREDATPRPLSPYAVDKLASEHFVTVFAELFGMENVTLRYFNVFGPRQDPSSPYSGVISLFVTALLAGRRPVIYGDGLQSRDFTYVANVVEANRRALKARGLCGQTVNVATGERTTLRMLLTVLARAIGRKPAAKLAKPRPGDIRHSLADIRAARRLLGYRPAVGLDEGLKRTVAWYRETQPSGKR